MGSRRTGDRPWDLTVPGRDQLCKVLGERSRAKGGSCQGSDFSSIQKHIFHFFLIKQLIFNYKSEAGSPHEMSYVIYQKQSSLGRYGPWPRFKPGSGSGC